jgi:hypothetical protein
VYKHRKLVSRWKKNNNPADRMLADRIKKEIRIIVNEIRREKVRIHIKPGNPKLLWDAVNIAKDEDASPIPSEMTLSGIKKREGEIAKAFQTHFRGKVEDIIASTKKKTTVHNGYILLIVSLQLFCRKRNMCLRIILIYNLNFIQH